MSEPEESLVVRARGGDRAAFEELVRRCARWMFARMYLETGDAHLSEDLVQEALLRAWRKLHTLADAKLFRAWLGSIAHCVVVDSARRDSRTKRGKGHTGNQAVDALPDTTPTPDASSDLHEQRQRALAVLRSLPEEYRAPLMLRYLTGADYETISRQLALSNGSLRGLLQRGLKVMRDEMNRKAN
ncbi:MAG: RNA polymerase sigma factor [Tepidisphaeraceae bacterium]